MPPCAVSRAVESCVIVVILGLEHVWVIHLTLDHSESHELIQNVNLDKKEHSKFIGLGFAPSISRPNLEFLKTKLKIW